MRTVRDYCVVLYTEAVVSSIIVYDKSIILIYLLYNIFQGIIVVSMFLIVIY